MSKTPPGNGEGQLTLYSSPNFGGDSKKFSDNDPSLKVSWGGKPIKSLVIEGNPWCFYPEESMKVRTVQMVFEFQFLSGLSI